MPTETGNTTFETQREATRRYRLRDPKMNNAAIAEYFNGAIYPGNGDFMGMPGCFFFQQGAIVAVRTEKDEIAVLHVYQSIQRKMEDIADRITG